jgi:hypothetical protein
MVNEVKEVLSVPFETVVATPLSLKLLNCYSKLYLCGGQPRTCTNSQRTYYQELIKTGITMAEKYDKAQVRTCKPAWNGLKYIPATARHWNSQLVTDEEAEMLLKKGFLTEKDFSILPSKPEPVKLSKEEQACVEEFTELLKAGTPETEFKELYKDVKKIGKKNLTDDLLNKLITEAKKNIE